MAACGAKANLVEEDPAPADAAPAAEEAAAPAAEEAAPAAEEAAPAKEKTPEKQCVAEEEAKEEPKIVINYEKRNVKFKAGKAGFSMRLGDGVMETADKQLEVIKVTDQGQAFWKGVKPGWILNTINGEGVDKDRYTNTFSQTAKTKLIAAAKSGKAYSMVFKVPKGSK